MLDRFINLARIMKLTSVVLYDESEAYFHPSTYGRNDCHLPLAYLRTLMRGKSWYQSRGFVTNHNQEYSEHNEHTRNMRLDDFVTQVTIKHFNSPDESEDQLNSIMEIFPGVTPEMKVSDAFQLMSDQTNDVGSTVCESKQFTTLKMLVESCLIGSDDDPPLIMYEDDLRTLTLSPSP